MNIAHVDIFYTCFKIANKEKDFFMTNWMCKYVHPICCLLFVHVSFLILRNIIFNSTIANYQKYDIL